MAVFIIIFPLVTGMALALLIMYVAFGYRYHNFWEYIKSYFKE